MHAKPKRRSLQFRLRGLTSTVAVNQNIVGLLPIIFCPYLRITYPWTRSMDDGSSKPCSELQVVERGGVIRITLDRPAKRNELSQSLVAELAAILNLVFV